MIKRQFELAKEQIARQHERLKKELSHPEIRLDKRQFLQSIYEGQQYVRDRESAFSLITYTFARLRQLHKDCGAETVWKVLKDV